MFQPPLHSSGDIKFLRYKFFFFFLDQNRFLEDFDLLVDGTILHETKNFDKNLNKSGSKSYKDLTTTEDSTTRNIYLKYNLHQDFKIRLVINKIISLFFSSST